MKVFFLTLGCRVNRYETDAVRAQFIERGHEPVDDPQEADCCVVNTCTVTSEADRKSRQMLRRVIRANRMAIVVAMGCASEMADGMLNADIVLGTRDKNQCVQKVEEFRNAKIHQTMHTRPEVSKTDVYHDFGTVLSPEGTRAFIKIEDGCNKFCSYCIIPYARGRVASRDFDSIIKEAKALADAGYKEIVLTGIHICSYGQNISDLTRVISTINDIEGVARIRMGSLEPMSITKDFVEDIAKIDKVCPHFHLSLQSGCDRILKLMKRDYTSEEYAQRVEWIREKFPAASVTTDIICGFPEETTRDFEESLAFAEKINFSKIHTFPYSLREGTAAARLVQIPGGIKKARTNKLLALSQTLENSFAQEQTGKKVSVLIEQNNSGYTENYVRAKLDKDFAPGTIVKGTVTGADGAEIIVEADT